jgi:hypothetical protein
VLWRTILASIYAGIPLACCVAWNSGWSMMLLFAVWAVVWIAYAVFWDWANRRRQALLQRPSST